MPESSSSLLVEVSEVRLGVAGALLFTLTAGLRFINPGTSTALVAYLVVMALASCTVGRRSALLLAVTAWALFDGFTVGAYGQLTVTRPGMELLALLAAVALTASAVGASLARPQRRLDQLQPTGPDLALRRVR